LNKVFVVQMFWEHY